MASTETAPSPQSEIQRELFRTFGDRLTADPPLELDQIREMFEGFHALAAEPTEVCYEEVDAGGIPSLWCLPIGAAADRVMLFFHGGGFVTNTASSHRKMAGAPGQGRRRARPGHRLPPGARAPLPAQLEDAVVAYRWLLDQGIAAEHIFTCGDSAGGNLATSLPLKLRDEGLPLPAAIVAISPWYDMEAKGETLKTNAETDTLVRPGLGEGMAAMFLGEAGSPTDPLANPLHADMHGNAADLPHRRELGGAAGQRRPHGGASRGGRSRHHPGDRARHAARLHVPGRPVPRGRPDHRHHRQVGAPRLGLG